ncbi:MAG: hypothetical protein IJJ86_04040 [Clostridia bacterium]|nr:hypothetical protein [Clostridia bacterium]
MRRVCLMLLLLALLLPTGCMQSRNLDEYAYILNVGVERGTTMPYHVTFLVSVPNAGTEEALVKNVVIGAEARTLSEAVETLNAAYPGRLSFSRASLLVLHEDLARAGEQGAFLDFSFGKTDLWQNLRVAVSRDPIRELFEGWTSETDPSLRKIKTAAGDLARESGVTADVGYDEYLEAVSDKRYDAMLAYAGVSEYALTEDLVGGEAYPYVGGSLLSEGLLKTAGVGCAVFDGERMVGILSGRHVTAVLMVTDAFRRAELLFPLPDGTPMSVALYRVRAPKITMNENGARAELFLEAEPVSPQSTGMEREELKAFLSERIESELKAVLSALQRVNSDAMGFGRYAVRRFKSTEEWEAYDWKATYRTLNVTFSVKLMLSHEPASGGTT